MSIGDGSTARGRERETGTHLDAALAALWDLGQMPIVRFLALLPRQPRAGLSIGAEDRKMRIKITFRSNFHA